MSVPFGVMFSGVNVLCSLMTILLYFYSHTSRQICTRRISLRQCFKASRFLPSCIIISFVSKELPHTATKEIDSNSVCKESSVMIGSKVIWLVVLIVSAIGYVMIGAILLGCLFMWH